MNDFELTLPAEEHIVGKHKLDIKDDYANPSDLATLLYDNCSSNYFTRTLVNNSNVKIINQELDSNKVNSAAISVKDDNHLKYPYRLMIEYSKDLDDVIKKGKTDKGTVLFGEYPLVLADQNVQNRFHNPEEILNNISKTGKSYTLPKISKDEEIEKWPYNEYEIEGQKYVLIIAGRNSKPEEKAYFKSGDMVLMKVVPVEWYIDEKARTLVSKESIFSGVKYMQRWQDISSFQETKVKSFLNTVKDEMFRGFELDKQSEPLNIDNDEWLIEDGVLKQYRGEQKEVIVPEGAKAINGFYFDHLKSIKLPKTLSEIYWYLFPSHVDEVYLPNNMTTFKLPEMLTSHAKNLYFNITSNLVISPNTKISEDLTLHIDCSMTDYNNTFIRLEEILPQFGPVYVILYGTQNLNILKKFEIMKRFSKYGFTFKDKAEEKTIDKQDMKEEIFKDIVDPELKERLDTITYLTKHLEENQRSIIIKKVKEILENAEEAQESMKPTLDFNSKSSISLTNEPNNVKSLHYSVINELDSIITSLNRNIESIDFLKELSRIEENLHNGNVTKPEKIESTNDKIDFICFVCKEYNNKEINDRFQQLLDKTQEAISKQIGNFNQYNLMLESPSTNFRLKVENIFLDAEKYEWLISTLEAKSNNDLSHDIKSVNSIINKLDDVNKNKYSYEMNTLVNKYKTSDLNKTKEEITKEIRRDLDIVLSDLSKIVNNSVKLKNIVDSVNYCLDSISAKNINGLDKDIRIGNSIYEILSKCPEEIYDNTLNEIIKTLKKWQVKLIEDKDIANDYLDEKEELGKDVFKLLDSPSIVYVAVLKEFEDIKYAVDTYISQKNFYENNKRVY